MYIFNKPKLTFLAVVSLILSVVCFQNSCGRRGNINSGESYVHRERQLLDSAKTSEEWMQRLKLDLEFNSYSSDFLVNLYAELPPQSEWPELIKSLEKIAGDVPEIKKLMTNGHGEQPQMASQKLLLFCALLKDGNADVEAQVRKLSRDTQSYHSEYLLKALLMVSKDHEATLKWIKEEHPEILESDSSLSSRNSESKKSGWEVAFADNKIDEGIELLKAEIENNYQRSEKANHLQKLIQIGLILDRIPLATEATEQLTARLLSDIKSKEYVSSYSYRNLFDLAIKQQNWQAIVDTFGKITATYEKIGKTPSGHDLGHLDQMKAIYLSALYHLGRTEEFIKEIKAAQSASLRSPDQFFDFLSHSASGQPPLAILYLDHLKVTGEKEQATAYATHLLARNQGKDVFYETLINLDEALARSFIPSLREFDPYEERPLIWLAELARRDGDLDLALKTIEQAIALDPSDGDHGKDTRMFCYEILARVHQEAGRNDKAKFFRDVVDSIRQGEAADDFLNAGLISEATKRYQKALGQFEDAYCLQSRLAMTLARNGRFEESVKHFKKAFELMPVSFGPRESHCFGCEGLFRDPRVIEIALPLLEEFEKSNPENPRTPYLLGLVLSEKKDYAQATIAYRRAFEIDPNYYNAATRLLGILEKDPEKFGEVKSLREKIFAIAPYPQKATYMPKQAQLRDHWELTENFPASPLKLPEIPFVPASEAVAKKDQYIEHDGNYYGNYISYRNQAVNGWSPTELRRQNEFLKAIDNLR